MMKNVYFVWAVFCVMNVILGLTKFYLGNQMSYVSVWHSNSLQMPCLWVSTHVGLRIDGSLIN